MLSRYVQLQAKDPNDNEWLSVIVEFQRYKKKEEKKLKIQKKKNIVQLKLVVWQLNGIKSTVHGKREMKVSRYTPTKV